MINPPARVMNPTQCSSNCNSPVTSQLNVQLTSKFSLFKAERSKEETPKKSGRLTLREGQ